MLLGVAILCDQYDCRRLVYPWIQGWMKNDWKESQVPRHEGWLFIAWYFGRQEIFEELAKTCVIQVSIDTDGERLIDDGSHILRPKTRMRDPSDFPCCRIATLKAYADLDFDMPLQSYPIEKADIPLPSGILG
jgi:hypothetical protein